MGAASVLAGTTGCTGGGGYYHDPPGGNSFHAAEPGVSNQGFYFDPTAASPNAFNSLTLQNGFLSQGAFFRNKGACESFFNHNRNLIYDGQIGPNAVFLGATLPDYICPFVTTTGASAAVSPYAPSTTCGVTSA
jgi:hypothetical protein